MSELSPQARDALFRLIEAQAATDEALADLQAGGPYPHEVWDELWAAQEAWKRELARWRRWTTGAYPDEG